MIVFKTFLKVLNKCKMPIILYTTFLIFFGGFNMKSSETSLTFVSTKPNILIVNKDEETGITKNLIDYLNNVTNVIKVKEELIDDSLFYREVNLVVYIPENYRKSFLKKENKKIEIKSTGDYYASLAEMQLNRYLELSEFYLENNIDEDTLIKYINDTLSKETKIEIKSKLDANAINKATFFYNFMNYSLLAGCIYVICLVISSFKSNHVNKRIIISSMNYKKHNGILLLSNGLFALILWLFYIILSFILLGDIMFTAQGIIYIINSLVFTIFCVSLAFFLSNLIENKNAINGIINVVALGSSFLTGVFVPMTFLPDAVLKIAHILPSYWFVKTNEALKTIETINIDTIKPLMLNMIVIIIFTIIFIILTNIITKRKQKIN